MIRRDEEKRGVVGMGGGGGWLKLQVKSNTDAMLRSEKS